MKRLVVALFVVVFVMAYVPSASAAPRSAGDSHTTVQASNAGQPQVMTDDDMGKVVGGEVNVPPPSGGGSGGTGGTPPPSVAQLVQLIEQDISQIEQLLQQDLQLLQQLSHHHHH